MRHLRAMTMRGLGSDPMLQVFNENLQSFKVTLLDLYRKKSKMISERESLRFQYLTGMKGKFNAIQGAIYNQVFEDRNGEGEQLIQHVMNIVRSGIPMSDLKGQPLQGWGYPPDRVGGRLGVSFLSPVEDIISKPFDEPNAQDQRPAYLVYKGNVFDHPQRSASVIVSEAWMRGTEMSGWIDNVSLIEKFTIPPSYNWCVLRQKAYPYYFQESWLTQYQYMVDILSKAYNGITLSSLLTQMKDMITDIVERTKFIVALQNRIDEAEFSLAEFVNTYKDSLANPLSATEILAEIMEESQRSVEAPAVIVDQVVAKAPVVMPEKKSSVGLYAAVAAGILFLTTRK